MVNRLMRAIQKREPDRYATALDRLHSKTLINAGLARAAATAGLRTIDPKEPKTWEFRGFSQHGEDGIIDYLCNHVASPTRFFFEIGAANGIENCTAWLTFAKSYGGVWVEGNPALCQQARANLEGSAWNVHVVNAFVTEQSIAGLLKMCPYDAPDVFSLDIDSVDYYVARKILEMGKRPKVWVVEYNSVFGPDRKVSIPYIAGFNRWQRHASGLYYGCSVNGWRSLFSAYNYTFVCVDQSGVNAFFIDPAAFPPGFADGLRGEAFRDNDGDLNGATRPYKDSHGDDVLPLRDWRVQYELISALPLTEIE